MSIFRRRRSGQDTPAPAPAWHPDGPAHEPGPPPQQHARMEPQVIELNAAELAWLDELRAALPGGDVPRGPEEVGELYDGLFDAWHSAPQSEQGDPNAVINALGVAVGDAVVARVPGARWAAVSDEHGTELAIVASSAEAPTMFPTAAVAKRWVERERGWVAEYIGWISDRFTQIASEPSEQSQELASFALGHAVHSIVPEGGPLIPFCLVESAEGRALHRFAGELGQAVENAREFARGSGAVRAAVAWDGYLTVDGQRGDALFVEASDAGQPSIILAHRYQETPAGTHTVGEPMLVDRGAPVL